VCASRAALNRWRILCACSFRRKTDPKDAWRNTPALCENMPAEVLDYTRSSTLVAETEISQSECFENVSGKAAARLSSVQLPSISMVISFCE